jgi:predicted nuclease with TOPRIM domain
MKKKTETKLDALTKENDGLRRENNYLKNEGTQLVQTLQHQKDGMKQLEKEFGQLKSQLHRQNTVVEVLSKRLVSVSPFSSLAICLTKLTTCSLLATINK